MHAEIEKLIQMALVDGVMSEKDQEIIVKKALILKVETNELNELKRILSNYDTDKKKSIKKQTVTKSECPNCGAEVSDNSTNCEHCDFLLADNLGFIKNNIKIVFYFFFKSFKYFFF